MPPKRKSDGVEAASTAKKYKDATQETPKTPKTQETNKPLWRHPRWSKVSASGNLDSAFRESVSDPKTAFEYLAVCKRVLEQRDEDDKDDEEDERDAPRKPRCDGGQTCFCTKPLAEKPEAKWSLSQAGIERFNMMQSQLSYRDPDRFGMYTFNDHSAFGILEVMENQILDFAEAKFGDWKTQWSICEALGMYIVGDEIPGLGYLSDPELIEGFLDLLEKMFLTMLVRLEKKELLKPDSEVKNLAAVMIMFMQAAKELANYGLEFPGTESKVLAYALKHDIVLEGLLGVEETVKEHSTEARKMKLPVASVNLHDPWKLKRTLKKYTAAKPPIFGFALSGTMGGDWYDVTGWSSTRRKGYSFDEKDPCDEHMMKMIKDGMVLERG